MRDSSFENRRHVTQCVTKQQRRRDQTAAIRAGLSRLCVVPPARCRPYRGSVCSLGKGRFISPDRSVRRLLQPARRPSRSLRRRGFLPRAGRLRRVLTNSWQVPPLVFSPEDAKLLLATWMSADSLIELTRNVSAPFVALSSTFPEEKTPRMASGKESFDDRVRHSQLPMVFVG